MNISMQVSSPKATSYALLEWVCLFCGLVLVLIWPLSGTIAARNTALVLGCLTSLAWVYCVRPKIDIQMALPILCLLAVPVWLWAHYFFLPTDTTAQLYDLKGTWLRVILAVIMAGGLGLMIERRPQKMVLIGLAMGALALMTLGRFFWDVSQTHQWVINDFRFPFKYKSAVVYFLMYPCLLAYAMLHYCLLGQNITAKEKSIKLALGLAVSALVGICWADFIAAHALNGVLVAGFMGMTLLIIWLIHGFRASKSKALSYWLLLAAVFVVLLTSLTLFWQYDQKYEHKLGNLVGDAQIAMQMDKYPQWQRDSRYQGPFTPSDASGRAVNGSTYERTAWFLKGVELLSENPWGAGFSHLAFQHYMLLENPFSMLTKTHSGWLDYALGLGLPGLLLTWLAMGLIAWRALKIVTSKKMGNLPIALISLWVLGGIWILWWPTEVSEREFIEYLFFMVALLGAANASSISAKAIKQLRDKI